MAEETKEAAANPTAKPAEKTDVKTEQKQAKVEKTIVKNCTQCSKPIKKKMGYYRNGKYYCNKRCFKLTKKVEEPAVS